MALATAARAGHQVPRPFVKTNPATCDGLHPLTDLQQSHDAEHADGRGLPGATTAASRQAVVVAAAAEGLAASIREISRQVSQSSRITLQAAADARRTDGRLRVIVERTERIRDVVGLIINITGRTNLLAFGTAIETAYVDEAEKEFSVVASEVDDLASQASRATEEIEAQIARIRSATKKFVDTINSVMGAGETASSI